MRRILFAFLFLPFFNCLTTQFITQQVSPTVTYGFQWQEIQNADWGKDGFLYVRARVLKIAEEEAGKPGKPNEYCYRSEQPKPGKPLLLEKEVPCDSVRWLSGERKERKEGMLLFSAANYSLVLPLLGENNIVFYDGKELPSTKPDRIFSMKKNASGIVLHYPDDSYFGLDFQSKEVTKIDPNLLKGVLAESLEIKIGERPDNFSMILIFLDEKRYTTFFLKKQPKARDITNLHIYSDIKKKEEFHPGAALFVPVFLVLDALLVALAVLAR